jgi:hypothetical protein
MVMVCTIGLMLDFLVMVGFLVVLLGVVSVRCGGRISPGSTRRIKDLTKGPRAQ